MGSCLVKQFALVLGIVLVGSYGFFEAAVAAQQSLHSGQNWSPTGTGTPAILHYSVAKLQSHLGHRPGCFSESHHGISPHYSTLSVTRYGFSYHGLGHKGVHLHVPFRPKYAKYYRAYGYGGPLGYGSSPGIYAGYGSYLYQPYENALDFAPLEPGVTENAFGLSSTDSENRLLAPNNALNNMDSTSPAFISTNRPAEKFQRRAEGAFRMGRYTDAARLANEALLVDGTNGLLMLFSAQANFAAGYYEQAVNEIESATGALPPDQWDFIARNSSEFYDQYEFVSQLNRLSARIDANPRDVNAHILRGFEYAAAGSRAIASNDFNAALLIEADNELALRLLREMTGTVAPILIGTPVEPTPFEIISPEFAPESAPDTEPQFEPLIPPPSVPENPLRSKSTLEEPTFVGPPIDGPDGNR